MDKCIKEIISVDGMEEIFNECNKCPEDWMKADLIKKKETMQQCIALKMAKSSF